MTSIIEMPELVLEKIIGFSDFKSILTLRQVCRDFRNFLDDLKDSKLPDSKFETIEIIVDKNNIVLDFKEFGVFSHRLEYSEFGRSKNYRRKKTVFESSNFVDVAIRDLELVLKFQKSRLERLYFDVDGFQLSPDSLLHDFPVKLSNMFKMLNQRIKTENFTMKMYNQSQIMRFIPFADPDALQKLILLSKNNKMKLEIDEMAKTEQWKNAQEIQCNFPVLNLKVEDICNFSRISLIMKIIAARDLETLRKACISSSKFEYAVFNLTFFNGNYEILDFWGNPFLTASSFNWYFRIKDLEEKVLHIEFCGTFINFQTIDLRHVLAGAIVQDYKEN